MQGHARYAWHNYVKLIHQQTPFAENATEGFVRTLLCKEVIWLSKATSVSDCTSPRQDGMRKLANLLHLCVRNLYCVTVTKMYNVRRHAWEAE
jgi:hypothetical protein